MPHVRASVVGVCCVLPVVQGARQVTAHRHRCPAHGCTAWCKRDFLMCYRHWNMVPRTVQKVVWSTWLNDVTSPERSRATSAATGAVCLREHGSCTPPELVALESFGYNKPALLRGIFLTLPAEGT